MSERTQPIRPELLAAKMEKVSNFEQPELFEEFAAEPRLIEALWFLQYVSLPQNYAGGLSKFATDIISQSADALGTAHVLKAGRVPRYEVSDAVTILRELPERQRSKLFGDEAWIFKKAFRRDDYRGDRVRVTKEDLSRCCWAEDRSDVEEETWEGSRRDLEKNLLARLTPVAVRELCCEAAREELSEYLKQLCESPHIGFRRSELGGNGAPWYFVSIANALLQFMERRSEALRATIAETEITQLVLRWMDKARRMKRPIMISGNSRFGKTEAVKLYAAMNPGACRLIETPATNAIGDLLREVAKALGIEVGPQNSGRELRERIDYVLRFSTLLLCFDEAQLLLPVAYSRNTAPARLNWVRRSVIDRNIAAVFICTPQSYLPAKKRFVRATGFAMEQFDERLLKTVDLPGEPSEADLLAIARIHFPGLRDEYLHFIVDQAIATERNFVSDIEKIATLAKDNASENGREVPNLGDVKAAMTDVLPTPKAPRPTQRQPLTRKPSPTPVQPPCTRSAEPMQTGRNTFETLPENCRETRPVTYQT